MKGFNYKTELYSPNLKFEDTVNTLTLNAKTKEEAGQIEHVLVTHIFTEKTTGLKEADGIRTIYLICIETKSKSVPLEFIKALDKIVIPHTVFEVDNGEGFTYLMAVNKKGEYHKKREHSEWVFVENPKFKDMADLYRKFKNLIMGGDE